MAEHTDMQKTTGLTGQRFGRWTVLDDYITVERKTGGIKERKWLCRCECGTERYVLERGLLYGGSQSCGCLTRERFREATTLSLAGKTFGDLTVLEQVEERSPQGGVQWRCRCSCGEEYIIAGTLLVTGRVSHCPNREAHKEKRNYKVSDITGQKFERLTALYPVDERTQKGGRIWHCRCDCGNEVDVPYNDLLYSNMKSCGCQKKENDQKLQENLTRISGTSMDMIRSKKIPTDNTTGYKGVYRKQGKYFAKLVFQQKQYHLGTYDRIEDAADARKKAEEDIFDEMDAYYAAWKIRADLDPQWAEENPVYATVERNGDGTLRLVCTPELIYW